MNIPEAYEGEILVSTKTMTYTTVLNNVQQSDYNQRGYISVRNIVEKKPRFRAIYSKDEEVIPLTAEEEEFLSRRDWNDDWDIRIPDQAKLDESIFVKLIEDAKKHFMFEGSLIEFFVTLNELIFQLFKNRELSIHGKPVIGFLGGTKYLKREFEKRRNLFIRRFIQYYWDSSHEEFKKILNENYYSEEPRLTQIIKDYDTEAPMYFALLKRIKAIKERDSFLFK